MRFYHRSAIGITPTQATKLGPRYFGPYQILAHIGSVTYRLQLPPQARIHDVFHVALLKPFVGSPPSGLPVPLLSLVHGRVVPVPLRVVPAHLFRSVWELLVQWEGHSAEGATWITLDELKTVYPDFQLKDELFQGDGVSVVDSCYGRTFRHRNK